MGVATTNRVETNTSAELDAWFQQQLHENVSLYAHASTAEINERLRELDREWNIERLIEVEAPTMIGLGVILGLALNRSWYALSALAASMVILHNLQGWYPLLPLFRRMGIRTQNEIEQERSALRALRGDHKTYQTHVIH